MLKDFNEVERALRRAWIQFCGPMRQLTSDRESAINSDMFGVWCEAREIDRVMATAKDDHGKLGILNRKSLVFRNTALELEKHSHRRVYTWNLKI